jgi:hypothetical protein
MKPGITEPPLPLWRRVFWFAGIWAASVASLGVVAWIIRLLLI